MPTIARRLQRRDVDGAIRRSRADGRGSRGSDPAGLTPWWDLPIRIACSHRFIDARTDIGPVLRHWAVRAEHLKDRVGAKPGRRPGETDVGLRARPEPIPRLLHQARLDRVAVDVAARANQM